MITKSDWDAVQKQMIEEEQQRLEPPTAEEMRAYTQGKLSEEEEEHVRERLLAYPELVRTLAVPFPEPAEPGDADYLSEHEFARLRRRRTFSIANTLAAVAAIIAVVTSLGWWQSWTKLAQPRVAEPVVLRGSARGGSGADTLQSQKPQLLYLSVPDEVDFPNYRVEISEQESHRVVWRSDEPLHRHEDAVTVFIPANFLSKGSYDVVLYGVSGPRQEELARNPVRVK